MPIQNYLQCDYFDKIKKSIELAASDQLMKINDQAKTKEINRVKESFIKIVNEIEQFNGNEYKKNSKLINSRIKLLTKNYHETENEELQVITYREYFEKNVWFIEPSRFKNEKTKLKYPFGLLVCTDIHVPTDVLNYYRSQCEEYTFNDRDEYFDMFAKTVEKKNKTIKKMYNNDDDDDDEFDEESDDSDHGYGDYVRTEKAYFLSQDLIARHEIFTKITEIINSDTENENIIEVLCSPTTELKLVDLSINYVDSQALKNYFNLKHLDLSENIQLDKINKDAFKNLNKLETLIMKGETCLQYLPAGCFTGLNNLTRLEIYIEHILPNSFDGLVNLEYLDMKLKTKLEIWRMSPFKDLKKLKTLKFELENDPDGTESESETYFEEGYVLFDTEFDKPPKEVNVKKTLSKSQNECIFLKWLTNLEEIVLIGIDNKFLKANCFKPTPKLKQFSLEKSSLYSITADVFCGLENLTQLNITLNEINSIEQNAFAFLASLETIKLTKNKIKKINENAFTGLTNLKTLDLSETKINENVFQKIKLMKNVNMIEKQDEESNQQSINEKIKMIEQEFSDGMLKGLINNYFNQKIESIEFMEKRVVKNMKQNEIEQIAKIKAEFLKKIAELKELNLEELAKNSTTIISNLKEIKELNLNEKKFEQKQNKELIKYNCWFIHPDDLKKRTNRLRFPFGVLILTDLHVSEDLLISYRNKCESYDRTELLEGYMKKYKRFKNTSKHNFDNDSNSDSDSDSEDGILPILNQVYLAKNKIFIDISNQIRDENKSNFIIDANCSSIEHLDLGWGEGDITCIELDALKNFTSLKSLDLKNNVIKSINDECFRNLINLEELDLSENYLERLPVDLFSSMHNLKRLNLDGNILNCKIDLKQLTSLEELTIEISQKQNPVVILKMLESLKSLKKLTFKWSIDEDNDDDYDYDDESCDEEEILSNDISLEKQQEEEKLSASDYFKELNNLEELCLYGLENYGLFETDCFKHFQNLKVLKLENCLISCIKKNLFIGLKELSELELVSNQIDTIEENAFEILGSLSKLDLGYNRLKELKKTQLTGLNNLEYLIISENSIESIENETFDHLTSLKEVDLSNNNLQEINEDWFKNLKNLEKKSIECDYKPKKHFIGSLAKKIAIEKMASKKDYKKNKKSNKSDTEDSDTEDMTRAILALLLRNKYGDDDDDDYEPYEYKTYGSGGWRLSHEPADSDLTDDDYY